MTPGRIFSIRLRLCAVLTMALSVGSLHDSGVAAGAEARDGGQSNRGRPAIADVKGLIGKLLAVDAPSRIDAAKALEGVDFMRYPLLDAEDVATLAEALQADDGRVRRAAARAFSQLTHTRRGATWSRSVLTAITAALKDRDTAVAAHSAIALGHIGDKAALDPLIAALNDDRDAVVASAAGPLGHLIDEGSAARLVPVLRREQARPVVRSLFEQLGGRAPVAELTTALSSPETELRRGAAFVLEGLGDRRSATALLHALQDADSRVRASGARSIGRIGDRTASAALIGLLDDADPEVRGAAVDALSSVGGPEAVEPLIARLAGGDPAIRSRAISALVRIADDRSVGPLIALLADEQLGDSLYHTLGHWAGSKALVRALIAAMASPQGQVGRQAARILIVDNAKVLILGGEAVAPLLPLLRSPEVEVRRGAALTLQTLATGRFLDHDAKGPLTEASRDDDPQVQQFAARALGHLVTEP